MSERSKIRAEEYLASLKEDGPRTISDDDDIALDIAAVCDALGNAWGEMASLRAKVAQLHHEVNQARFSAYTADRIARVATDAAKTLAVGLEAEQRKRVVE